MCFSPIKIRGNEFACGKCPECLAARRSQWRQRMFFESKLKNKMFFVTLTYRDECLPNFSFDGKLYSRVSKKDVQNFHKRLRRFIEFHHFRISFRYLVVSEYGPKTKRPHYHGVYFVYGRDWREFKKIIKKVWKFGFSDVTLARNKEKSCSYVSNYFLIMGISPYTFLNTRGRGGSLVLWNHLEEYINSLYNNSCTFVLSSRSLGNTYFLDKIKDRIKQNFEKLIRKFADGQFDILSIIKHLRRENFLNVDTCRLFCKILQPYVKSLFYIPINRDFHFLKLNKLYAYEISYHYAHVCNCYYRCSHIVRNYDLCASDARAMELQRKDQEKKLLEFALHFDKKRYRNCQTQKDII